VRPSIAFSALITVMLLTAAFSMNFSAGLKYVPLRVEEAEWYEVARRYIRPSWSQGVAHDSEHWYFSGAKYLGKTNRAFQVTLENKDPIPKEMVREGYNHIGDIDVFEGMVYAPVENVYYANAAFMLYYAENLTYTGICVKTEQSHMPWCAINPATGCLYSSEFSNVNRLYVYDVEAGFKRLEDIALDKTLQRVQGGAFYHGYLFLSCDDNGHGLRVGDHVYVVDVNDGKVVYSISVNIDREMEGITLHDLSELGLGILHFIDNGFFIYHYAIKKTSSFILCSVHPREIRMGEPITITGSIEPPHVNAIVKLTYTKPDGSIVVRTLVTGGDGSFQDVLTSDQPGKWSVHASWDGDLDHEGAKSNTVEFNVKEHFPPIWSMGGIILAIVVIALTTYFVRRKLLRRQ